MGPFVHVKLDPAAIAAGQLVATEVEVKNFTNVLLVMAVNARGRPVRGNVSVQVVDRFRVRDASGRLVVKKLRFRNAGAGRIRVHGLPTGQAKVTVRRVTGGRAGRVSTPIQPNRTRRLVVRLP